MSSRNGRQLSATEDRAAGSAPQRPPMPPSTSAPVGRLPRFLARDVSQYSESNVPTAAMTSSSTSLAELAHLIRLQGYQEQRRSNARVRLHRWLVSSALSSRLVRCGELAHRTLVDSFRSDDKRTFAVLYNALHDVRSSCDATRRFALLEPDLEHGRSRVPMADSVQTFSTFIHEIPVQTRDVLLQFIAEVRTNPDFLASRITSLSQQELASVTVFRQALDPIESVMALQGRTKTGAPVSQQKNFNTFSAPSPSPVGRLLSFQRHDPLSTLLYTIFANSSGPDSAEDLRRTDAWATTCARLITEGRQGSDKFIKSVLDAWAGMREWPGKANLELYLMQVLQDGHFLLEKAEESSVRPKAKPEGRTTKDTIAAEEFYDKAVKRLFEVIDDEPSAGGIPDGVLEIANAILKKLEDSKKHRAAAQTFIVSRWFFSTFLLNAVIHPESQGIMTGHHISEHARQKILKEIAIRTQKPVLDMTYNWKQAVPILPAIRTHIESILSRFRPGRSHSRTVLLRAKAITSPRETVEVQPFLVICPADIRTLVSSLFPDRRPASSQLDKDFHGRNGLTSAASSISGVSIPFRSGSIAGDASSVLSISASSMTSDTTSREPLLESNNGPQAQVGEQADTTIAPTEEYGRRLKVACSEMMRVLGLDATAGSCHPCAERWAVLYVSPDGRELKTRMRKDVDDEDETEEDSLDSDSEDEVTNEKLDLENDYHQLKEAIARLVEEYEIPKELAPDSESKGFSNRSFPATAHARGGSVRGLIRAETMPTAPEKQSSKNPFHASASQSHLSTLVNREKPIGSVRHRSPQNPWNSSGPESKDFPQDRGAVLVSMLEAAVNQCQARSDFVNAHHYYKTLQQLRRLSSPSLVRNGYSSLLHYFSRGPRDSLGKAASAIEEFEAWFVWLKQSQERHETTINEMMLGFKTIRDKMWYITDVRNSAAYDEAKNVAQALKIMGLKSQAVDGRPISSQRSRQTSKASATNNFLLRTEAQIIDVLAANPDYCGSNKLADEQADMTMKWLIQHNIEIFCKGEERIHRFCLEIDKCVNQLVGDGILDGPVLWSSELYRHDKEVLDSGRQKGDLFLTGVGTLSIAGDEEYETSPGRPGSRSLDFSPRPSQGSLRSMAGRNSSQQSFESGKWSAGRGVDLMDSQDYLGGLSPTMQIDSSATFWSPFHAQAGQSHSRSTNIRPRTASSSKGTVMLTNSATVNDDKRRFLLDLKQTLTGLLLSDLGTIIFSGGSETDQWFSGELGEECFQRKAEEDRRRKRHLARKSMRSMKSGGARSDHRSSPLDPLGRTERGQSSAAVSASQNSGSDTHAAGEHSTSSSDATARSSLSAAKRAGLFEFPYNLAFRRLLRRFATHPNPFSKLHALFELEQLIVASLTARTGRAYVNRRDMLPTVPQSPTLGAVPELSSREAVVPMPRAQNLEETIANCEERRSHSMASPTALNGPSSPNPFRIRRSNGSGARSPAQSGPPSTDMIVDVLQGLFRDAEIRPKTLFRDLQYIASLVPAQMLDRTPRGKAFWDTALAALVLKQDVCRIMVEIADDIVAMNTQKRAQGVQQHVAGAGVNTGSAQVSSTASDTAARSDIAPIALSENDPLSRFSMTDAARMFIITAKEGDAVAERELAIFYLTHPDLLPRTVLPLTKPRDVFKGDLLRDSGGRGSRREDPARSDPITMCVAQHWMEMSKKGGDQLATKYLRARDEMERIP